MAPLRFWKRWPEWIRDAALVWTLIYGTAALYWSLGGAGFPLGLENDPAAGSSIFSRATASAGAPIAAVLCLLGAIALLLFRLRVRGLVRTLLLGYAWIAAATLIFAVPDARVLIATAYAPIALVAALIGRPVHYLDSFSWPIVHQFVCLAGGLLWGAAVLSFQRRTRDACASCGRRSGASRETVAETAARWGRRATYVAIGSPVYYDATRIAWLFRIPLGISREMLDDLWSTGGVWAGMGLALVSLTGTVLMHGLIRPWGEIFPRWVPFWAGKRVPPALAIVPAALASVMIAVTGIQVAGQFLFEPAIVGLGWGASTPLLLLPVWGVALGIATIAYYYRRRGRCEKCGRG
ncbi:hypothetical protein H7C18_23820 [Cohnella sp. CBP 2801]|uniref:Uncharacterized protein n=1 Tax=Cohnella zeiphila TaxID=2761120 RepID=A0A7X0VXZ0_9BACL|nr:hypothetical protein [Cohnella zeiphila]